MKYNIYWMKDSSWMNSEISLGVLGGLEPPTPCESVEHLPPHLSIFSSRRDQEKSQRCLEVQEQQYFAILGQQQGFMS